MCNILITFTHVRLKDDGINTREKKKKMRGIYGEPDEFG